MQLPEWSPPPRRVVVFRALKLGDMLCAVPALRTLRGGFPDAEIVLVGPPWAREFVDRFPVYLDGFREFPGWPGLPERDADPRRIEAFLDAVRAEEFDLAIQLHGSGGVSNGVVAGFGARRTAGFHEPGSNCPDPETYLSYPQRGLEVRRLLRLMDHLGLSLRGESLEFPIRDDEQAAARSLMASCGVEPGEFVCVHGGASVPERCWPPERFAAAADGLAEAGLRVVLTGSEAEAGITQAIARAMRGRAIDLAGQTPLGVLAGVLKGARMLVCNDTGVSHVAAALRVPSVVVSTGNNPERWAPADRRRHRVLCRDTGVTAAEVLAEALDLLDVPLSDRNHAEGWETAGAGSLCPS